MIKLPVTSTKSLLRARRPHIVIHRGTPIGVFIPARGANLERLLLSMSPEFNRICRRAEQDIRNGRVLSGRQLLELLKKSAPGKNR